MGYTALPTKNPGDVLTSALWNTYLQGNADNGFMRMLADITLGGSAASIDFTSIPATFAHLMLVAYLRGDQAATFSTVQVRFNNDSGANYDYQELQANGTSVAAAEGLAQTSALAGRCPAASAVANSFAALEMLIPHYAGSTNHKHYVARSGTRHTNAGSGLRRDDPAGDWRSAAAINRVTIIPGSGNFVAGSRATLYGIPQ